MCGIAGIFSYNSHYRVHHKDLTRMRDTMVHRGPDGGANWIAPNGRIGLAHRRLSIIDLSAAATQPMTNEQGTVWVTYNGEIYNHMELRHELIAAGHRFRTDHSDTEVIVHGYEQWGIDGLVRRIEGDFGIALWDTHSEKLYLIRDRVGVKPLYFSMQNGTVLFASEIKAIASHPFVERDVDPVAMYHYLSFLTTPAPLTMFKGIYKLPAGFYLEINSSGRFSSKQYWDALPGNGIHPEEISGLGWAGREQYYINGIQTRLDQAIEKRMMSDVPFGVFLSGGIDSSTNVALMARYMTQPVNTFTVGFKDYTHLNELDEAKLIAKQFKTNHNEILIEEQDMVGYLNSLIHHQDEPIADWVCIPLYFVSKLAKDSGVTVVQVGEGSDEQFCGYSSYMNYLKLYQKYWRPFRQFLPGPVQRTVAVLFGWLAGLRPSLEVYADIIDRASRNREHFWSGATVFWDIAKKKLVVPGTLHTSSAPAELIQSGLLPVSYLEPDTFNIIRSFNERIDKSQNEADVLNRMIYNEFKLRLPELLLMRVDKVAMSVSVEARVPFLDHHLVEFTMDIPRHEKVYGNTAKYLLKKSVAGLIPDKIINRQKMGFAAPMSQWLRGEFGKHTESVVMKSSLLERAFFNRAYIANLFAAHRSEKRDNGVYIWALFNLISWYDYWIDNSKFVYEP